MFDKDSITELVLYTRDNSVMSSQNAYNAFNALYQGNIDISMFFENLNSYEYMHDLYVATKNVKVDNNEYKDEYEAYLSMHRAMSEIDPENHAEICAVSPMCDYTTNKDSMNIARGGAKENGQEGQEYTDEKNKVHSDIRKECSDIYDEVRTDADSKLIQLRLSTVNNANVRN